MSFWKFCEKVSTGAGVRRVMSSIDKVYQCWEQNDTVGDCIKKISLPDLYRKPIFFDSDSAFIIHDGELQQASRRENSKNFYPEDFKPARPNIRFSALRLQQIERHLKDPAAQADRSHPDQSR